MKAHEACALFATFLLLWMLASAACRPPVPPIVVPPIVSVNTYTLGPEAHADDLVCVVNEVGPLLLPTEAGVHCARVILVRRFIANLRFAEH